MRITRELSMLWEVAVRYHRAPSAYALTQLKVAALEFGASEDVRRVERGKHRWQKRRERRNARRRERSAEQRVSKGVTGTGRRMAA